MTIQPLKGFRDYLPPQAWARQWLKNKIIPILESWSYEPLETPTLEPAELFTGEIGEEEKLFYKFKDLGRRDVMLRYDQTLPTCRVVAQNINQLIFPWRRYQIQSNFRAEKPQAGRYREFTQVDFDIFGVESRTADAEVIALTLEVYKQIGFKDVVAVINSRELMKDIPYPAIVAIDKLEKIGETSVIADMENKGISSNQARDYLNYVKNLQPNEEIKTIFDYLKGAGYPDSWYRFQPTLARSFSYSQGPIWEIIIPGYLSGSVAGGERYDGIFNKLIGKPFPGTGIALGFDRTLEAAQQFNLIPPYVYPAKILVTVFSSDLITQSLNLSVTLRSSGIPTELYPDPDVKLDKQLKYASKKGIPYVAILGPEEVEKNLVTLKNMSTGEQQQTDLNSLITQLSPST
jgi:histidyl-tRNA synthetase